MTYQEKIAGLGELTLHPWSTRTAHAALLHGWVTRPRSVVLGHGVAHPSSRYARSTPTSTACAPTTRT